MCHSSYDKNRWPILRHDISDINDFFSTVGHGKLWTTRGQVIIHWIFYHLLGKKIRSIYVSIVICFTFEISGHIYLSTIIRCINCEIFMLKWFSPSFVFMRSWVQIWTVLSGFLRSPEIITWTTEFVSWAMLTTESLLLRKRLSTYGETRSIMNSIL